MHESVCEHPMSYLVPVRLLCPISGVSALESLYTVSPQSLLYRVSRYTVHHFLPLKISLPFLQVQLCIQIFDGILFYPKTLSICNRRVPCYVNLSLFDENHNSLQFSHLTATNRAFRRGCFMLNKPVNRKKLKKRHFGRQAPSDSRLCSPCRG